MRSAVAWMLAVAAATLLHAAAGAATDDAPPARVIVGYRADAGVLRDHPWLRTQPPRAGRDAVVRRAEVLARRSGLALQSGRAVGDRAQVVLARGLSGEALARRLSADPDVEYAVVDRRRRALNFPDDPYLVAGPALNETAFTGGPVAGQWYLRAPDPLFVSASDVVGAWSRTRGVASLPVAVLDTGVLFGHPDLAGQLLSGYDFVNDADSNFAYANDGGGRDPDASDPGDWVTSAESASGPLKDCDVYNSSWHGTKVSGIVGATTNNALGMAGVAHGAKVLPVRVLGKCGGYDSDIAAGMLWAAGVDQPGLPGSATPARVLNLSLGGTGSCSRFYQDAVESVRARGAVIVAAAGNSVGRAVGTPANCRGVIAVAGLRHAGSKVGFSDLGPEISIAAPGGNCVNIRAGQPCLYPLLTTTNTGAQGPNTSPAGYVFSDSYRITVGTSFATPIVAGTAALMLAVRPILQPEEVRRVMQTTARPFPTSGADNGPDDPTPVPTCRPPDNADQLQCYCTTALCGAGMLDASRAVALAATTPLARVEVQTPSPVASSPVTLSAQPSLPAEGRRLVAFSWRVVSGAASLSGASDAVTATVLPSAAGSVVVRLSVTDDVGLVDTVEQTLAVAVAPVSPPTPSGGGAGAAPASGGGGGGASSAGWLLALAGAVLGLLGRQGRPASVPPRASQPLPCTPSGRTPGHGRGATPRRLALVALLAPLLATAAGGPRAPASGGLRAQASDDVPVRGLIVRLHGSPSHSRLADTDADARRLRDRQALRWRTVMEEADLGPASREKPARVRAVGRDQQLLEFGRPMSRADAAALAERLAARPDVAWVDFNVRERRLQVGTNPDPAYTDGRQWWLRAVSGTDASPLTDRRRGVAGFETAWLRPLTGNEPAVAVLDTGITAHPELVGRLLPGYDFVSDLKFAGDGDGRDADPTDPGDYVSATDRTDPYFASCDLADSSWHGTVIAGMLAALTDNGTGVAALNARGRVLPVRVAGKCGADVADIVDGMRWAAGLEVAGVPRNPNPVRIVNVSFGGSAACSSAYQMAVDELKALGVVVVAAAGNEHVGVSRPANCTGVVGVAALNRDGFKASYSNFGAALKATGLAVAAGDDDGDASARWNALADPGIFSTINTGAQGPVSSGYGYVSGTSFAAPQVAGAIALMLRVNAQLTWSQIVDGLRRSARPHVTSPYIGACSWTNPGRCLCTTDTCGAGILDADQALAYAAAPSTWAAPARAAAVIASEDVRVLAAAGQDLPGNTGPAPITGGGSSSGGGSGGGAASLGWLLALALAAAGLSAVGVGWAGVARPAVGGRAGARAIAGGRCAGRGRR